MQVKSYSKLESKRNANDKGYVSIGFSIYVKGLYKEAIHASFFRLTLLLAFIFLNILTLVTLTKSVSLYYQSIGGITRTSSYHSTLHAISLFYLTLLIIYMNRLICHTHKHMQFIYQYTASTTQVPGGDYLFLRSAEVLW